MSIDFTGFDELEKELKRLERKGVVSDNRGFIQLKGVVFYEIKT
jgi:hypothetical protein